MSSDMTPRRMTGRILHEGFERKYNAPIAQLVEQLPFKETVAGSIPAERTRHLTSVELWP